MERSPLTIVIWLIAAVLTVVVGMRVLGDGGGGGPGGGEEIRLSGGAAVAAAGSHGAAGSGAAASPQSAGALVHVAGEVRAPGLYRIASDARVAAAVERAGGLSRRADPTAINLAARIQDGQQIVVPSRAPSGAGTVGSAVTGVKPSLGSASVEQLEELDGIGPGLAQRIVDYRQDHGGFRSVEDLADVEGIGEKRLASLREALQP